MSIFAIATSLFFILNSLGNIPFFVGMLGKYPVKRQRRIILRELAIALLILLLFNFFGENILHLLGISHAVIGIAGGTLLFLISLSMIFPPQGNHTHDDREPFIFPLAIPVLAGPGSITTVMIYSQQVQNELLMLGAILMAWIPSTIILLASSNIKLFLGQKGLIACERLGGMLISLIAVQMLTSGIIKLIQDNLLPLAK
jgi:multiple antibiotic resistance protein